MCDQLGISGWVKNSKKGTIVGKMQGYRPNIEQMWVESKWQLFQESPDPITRAVFHAPAQISRSNYRQWGASVKNRLAIRMTGQTDKNIPWPSVSTLLMEFLFESDAYVSPFHLDAYFSSLFFEPTIFYTSLWTGSVIYRLRSLLFNRPVPGYIAHSHFSFLFFERIVSIFIFELRNC